MPELIPAEPGTPEWLAARRAGVTATDIVTILGLSSYDSVYSLFWRKMGQVPEVPDNDRFALGRYLETYVLARWFGSHPAHDMQDSGLYRSSVRPWQMATVDALAGEVPLEVKTWADADRHSWGIAGGTEAPPSDFAITGALAGDRSSEIAGSPKDGARPGPIAPRIPPAVRAQVLWQMDVMDVARGHAGVVFLPSGEFRSYVIEHEHSGCGMYGDPRPGDRWDCSVCADLELIRAAGEEFMRRLRLELPPPDPDSSAATLAAVRARFTRQPDKTADVDAETWVKYLVNAQMIDAHQELKREAEIQLREQAGEASVLTVGGQPVARRIIVDAEVKTHVRHQDYLRRITQQGDDDE